MAKLSNTRDSGNYREVMISTNLFKVFEYSLLPTLKSYAKLSRYQFGYRENTSTLLATTLLKEAIGRYIGNDATVYACFLDMSKAYERVDHKKLIDKLISRGMPNHISNIIEFILNNSFVKINFSGHFSGNWKASRGIRQGGVTSAILFCIYIDDIIKNIASQPYCCRIGINKINVQAYADDVVIFCPTAEGLRVLIQIMEDMIMAHQLMINVDKTKIVIFNKKKNIISRASFKFNGVIIENVSSYKYLGIIINCNLSEKEELKRMTTVFNSKCGMFFRKFGTANFHVKLKLFDALCMSFYALELCNNRSGCLGLFRQLAVSYHWAIKRLLGFPKWERNHFSCAIIDRFVFKHFAIFKATRYLFWLRDCTSPCFVTHKTYMTKFSLYYEHLNITFQNDYNVPYVLENDFSALVSRLKYVQNSEHIIE